MKTKDILSKTCKGKDKVNYENKSEFISTQSIKTTKLNTYSKYVKKSNHKVAESRKAHMRLVESDPF